MLLDIMIDPIDADLTWPGDDIPVADLDQQAVLGQPEHCDAIEPGRCLL